MNQEQLELIQKILASQNKQLQVDAVKMVQREENVPNREKAIEIAQKHIIKENKDKFPIQEEKEREEKRRYTETFRKALEEEQKQLVEKKKREEEKTIRQKVEKWKQELEKRRKERRKYTQTFREALKKEIKGIIEKRRQEVQKKEEEKSRKEEERKKQEIEKIKRRNQFNKVMQAYEKQEIVLNNYDPFFIEKLQKLSEKWENTQENQVLSRQEQLHKDFMIQIQPQRQNLYSNSKVKERTQKYREER